MVQFLVTADDLTGGNASGILFRKMGFRTKSVIYECIENHESVAGFDVVACSTESRSTDPETAYRRVFDITRILKSADL